MSKDAAPVEHHPCILILGTAQDGGSPQVNSPLDHPARLDSSLARRVACIGIVDPRSGRRWMIDATPDFRAQAHDLSVADPAQDSIGLAGIFLTHAHIGHYTGLMFLGHESMGARGIPVHAMPRMAAFLRESGPWGQLVRLGNIELRELAPGEPVALAADLSITPILVPHRQEYSEVVGFRIDGPTRSVLYIPDIDSWREWDETGVRIEDEIARVDLALIDGTFFANGEIPGRDMSTFPHPFITHSMERFAPLPAREKAKIQFTHLNHTNPAQWPGSPERRCVEEAGFAVAQEKTRFPL